MGENNPQTLNIAQTKDDGRLKRYIKLMERNIEKTDSKTKRNTQCNMNFT